MRVERSLAGVAIRVEDNGVGFDPAGISLALRRAPCGLKIMKERAHRVGGRCQVDSCQTGQGTQVPVVAASKMEVA